MFSLEQYVGENITLAKSLVIKLADVANAINKGLMLNPNIETKYKSIPANRKEWKYYMNLAGEKHGTNNTVEILVIELGQKEELTKDLLDNYKYTKAELLKCGSFYKELLNEYPDDVMYIHGCMYPVDKDVAINAKDGTILAYNPTLVYDNEYSIISELEKYCINFLSRWHINEYTLIEELYLASMLGVLYANLPNKLMAIRLDKVYTNEVHPFHMEHFFRSYLDIYEAVDILNNSSKFWLYNNLKYIKKNIGKNGTLDLVINKLLTANEVGIGTYLLRKPVPKYNNTTSVTSSAYTPKSTIGLTTELNSYYLTEENTTYNISTLVEKELLDGTTDSSVDTNRISYITAQAENSVKNNKIDNQRTKILELTTYNLFKRNGIDLIKLVIDHWVYGCLNNKLNFVAEYVDPNSNKIYSISPYIGLLLLFKLILNKLNLESAKLTYVNYDTLFTLDKDKIDDLYSRFINNPTVQFAVDEIKEYYPNINGVCNSVDDLNKLITDTIYFYNYLWALDVNMEDTVTSATLKGMRQFIISPGKYNLLNIKEGGEVVGKTIDEMLEDNNIVYTIEDTYNVDKSIEELIRTFTGIELDEAIYIKDISEGFKSLLQKLISYTLQVYTSDTGESDLFVYYNNTNVFKSHLGVLSVNDATLTPLEQEFTYITSYGNNYMDNIYGDTAVGYFTKSVLEPKKPFSGYMEILPDMDYAQCSPNFGVEVIDTPVYDYQHSHYDNN